MKIISVVGARPNFMKIAPFIKAINSYNNSLIDQEPSIINHILVHTGQHYDNVMSKKFFTDLDIPDANISLDVGSGTHAEQVGKTMIEFEKVLINEKPTWIVVVGDVNATLAASVTAKKLWIKVCHIEAGLRSGDMKMPEEINRLVTDRLADLLLTPDKLSNENLIKEGVSARKIKFVGNIMIDTLEANRQKAILLNLNGILKNNQLTSYNKQLFNHNFVLLTMHRPSNVDYKNILEPIINFLCKEIAPNMQLIWPIHPRAMKRLKDFDLWDRVYNNENIILLHPIGYNEMLRLNMDARVMLTDSGGLQEECTILGTPCITLRWNTERPITLREHGGASVLVGNNINRIRDEYQNALKEERKSIRPKLWDGKTAERCLKAILNYKD